jgi:hypothetical protein
VEKDTVVRWLKYAGDLMQEEPVTDNIIAWVQAQSKQLEQAMRVVTWLGGFDEDGIMIGNAWDASAYANGGECLCCHVEEGLEHKEDCEWLLVRALVARPYEGGAA